MVTKHGKRRHQRRGRRLVARAAVILGLLAGGGAWSADSAMANHPEVVAEVDCSGEVSFTATAYQPGDNDPVQRTNPRVQVFYSTDGGQSEVFLPWKDAWQYSPSNDFQFTDTFQLPDPLPRTVVVGVKKSRWANGSLPGPNYETAAIDIPSCPLETEPAPPGHGGAAGSEGTSGAVGSAASAGPVVPAVQAAPAATGDGNSGIVIVAVLIGLALVIDGVGITIFVRGRRSRAAREAAARLPVDRPSPLR
jgi:hypothetical protein